MSNGSMADAVPATPEIRDNADEMRWEARLDDRLAGFLMYDTAPGEITLIHTEVDPAFEGHGIGSRLARAALDDARSHGLAVIPECPFVRSYLRRHPEYRDLIRRPTEAPPG
jgi:uncharacterized protein